MCNNLTSMLPRLLITAFFIDSVLLPMTAECTSYDDDIDQRAEKIGDMFDILRENIPLGSEDDSIWSDEVRTWISNAQKEGVQGLEKFDENYEITRDSLWGIWNNLPTRTRDIVIRNLYPLLVPSGSEDASWRLHCSDAYKLCMADSNCYWKYTNFIHSCTDEQEFDDIVKFERAKKQEKSRQKRRHRPRSEGVPRPSRRKGIRRDVYAVERRMKKEALRHRSRLQRSKFVQWMGQKLYTVKTRSLASHYFSMKSRSNKCSSKCVDGLIMLNRTAYGALLAHCDCRAKTLPFAYLKPSDKLPIAETHGVKLREPYGDGIDIIDGEKAWDENTCILHQKTAQSCRPRKFRASSGVIGCTEARHRCEKDPICASAQTLFLSRCSQVINGVTCTKACRESVRKLRLATKNYDTCVCDSEEGPTCRQIRSNVARLCAVKGIPSDFVLKENSRNTSAENKWTLHGSMSAKDDVKYIEHETKYKMYDTNLNANYLAKAGNLKTENDNFDANASSTPRYNAVFMLFVLIWTQLFVKFMVTLS